MLLTASCRRIAFTLTLSALLLGCGDGSSEELTAGGNAAEVSGSVDDGPHLSVPAPEDRLLRPGEIEFLGYETPSSDNRLSVSEPGTYTWESPPIPPEYRESFAGIGVGIGMSHDPDLPTSLSSEEVEVDGGTVFRAEVVVGPFDGFPAVIEFIVSASGIDYGEQRP
jgi:hypothetical protein